MSSGRHNSPACKRDDGGGRVSAAVYLVSIAGSAGGFAPLHRILADLPCDTGAAVAAMLHTGSGSQLAEALRLRSRLPVAEAASGAMLRAGHAYVAPHGTHLVVNPDASLTVSGTPRIRYCRPSADWLFESAAASFRERHVAIILSGMLSDGAAKLRVVKQLGGTVLVQLPSECAWRDMPDAAIATGCADAVVPIAGMAAAISALLAKRDARVDTASWEEPFGRRARVLTRPVKARQPDRSRGLAG